MSEPRAVNSSAPTPLSPILVAGASRWRIAGGFGWSLVKLLGLTGDVWRTAQAVPVASWFTGRWNGAKP